MDGPAVAAMLEFVMISTGFGVDYTAASQR